MANNTQMLKYVHKNVKIVRGEVYFWIYFYLLNNNQKLNILKSLQTKCTYKRSSK
jgi:hypothetical protein